MASKIKVDQIEGSTASTVSLPSGQTLDLSSGSITLPDASVDLASAKVTGTLGTGNLPNIPEANLPTIPVAKGGTGLTSLGSAGQVVKVNSGANALEFATEAGGAVGNVQQVHYTGQTSVSGSGRGNSDIINPLNMTFVRDSQSSKVLLRYNITMGSTGDCWVAMKIQYSTDGSAFSDVPGITDEVSSNTTLPRGHIGNAYRGGGNNGWGEYTQWHTGLEYLHDTSAIASNTIYYRIILFKGHSSTSRTIYINRAENIAESSTDPNRNCGTSQLTAMEIL